MKKLFICAAALGLLAATPAWSAPDNNQRGNKHDAATQDTKSRPAPDGMRQNMPAGAMTGGAHTRAGGATPQGPMSVNRPTAGTNARDNAARRTNPQGAMVGNRPTAGTPANTHSRDNAMRNANPRGAMTGTRPSAGSNARDNAMHRDNSRQGNTGLSTNTTAHQPSINSLRRNVQASRRFHGGDYRAPQGYQPRHWGYGERLPRGYFVRNYWLTDFLTFGLFAPPPGLIWVRVGNDALLVDRYSGDIVQVDYDVFY